MLDLNYQADLFVPSTRTQIDQDFFNSRFRALYNQFAAFDDTITTYGQAEATLVQLGLARLNNTLGPLLTTLQNAAQLGFLVCSASGTSYSLALGAAVGWTITAGGSLFTPTAYLLAQDATDSTNWGILSVDAGGWVPPQPNHTPTPILTGSLATHVVYCTKTQASTSWSISANSAYLPAMQSLLNSAVAANNSAQAALASVTADVASVNAALGAISAGPVVSVAGRSGVVVLSIADIAGLTTTIAGLATTTQLGTKQNASAKLDALVNLTWAANKIIYATGVSTLGTLDISSSFIQNFLASVNAAAAVGVLGLSAVATSGSYVDLSAKPSLGTVAPLNVGTAANNVVQLDGSARLPAVDGSQLTHLPIPAAGGFIQHNLYTTPGGPQTLTIPVGATRAFVRMTGGGAGYNNSYGSGGSAGYLEKWLTGLLPGATLALFVGAGGTSGFSATAGGTTTLSSGTQSIATLTAHGGTAASASGPGSNGTASGGDFNISLGASQIIGQVIPFNVLLASSNYGVGQAGTTGSGGGLGVCCIDWFA